VVIELGSLSEAYRVAAELRRIAVDVLVDIQVEKTHSGARVLVPRELTDLPVVQAIVRNYGGKIVAAD
jgi:hypothetical protein